MKNLDVSKKIFLLSATISLLFCLVIAWTHTQARDNLLQARKAELRHAVETSWGVLNHFAGQAKQGLVPLQEAQQRALAIIREQRFGGDNYFWVNDLHPRMLMHPVKKELENVDLLTIVDSQGKKPFIAMAEVAKAQGEGFVEYVWEKPGGTEPVGKLSFVKLQPEWGWVLGSGLYMDDIQAQLAAFKYATFGAGAAVVLVVTLLVLFISRGVSRPLARAVEMIEALGRGELDNRLHLKQNDEVGRLGKAMDQFADSLQFEILTAFKKLAEGDFTFKTQSLIGPPLADTNAALSSLVLQIDTASQEIAQGGAMVTDLSQSLSQGAAEQAESLAQINGAIADSASQVKVNADHASKANELSEQAKAAALRGNEQMQHMVTAMTEINQASQDISKIIKVIDEIAFQTNLLALNAAVEAARAGQHGKGFAVVAEEVRNLAARSARAAKETETLIEGSVSKTENGAQIADRTAVALQEIVSGVTEVSDLVAEIASKSLEQAQGIEQINLGLGLIDQITQQNSGCAEESASAAETLSDNAQALQQQLQRFRLQNDHQQAPPAGDSPQPESTVAELGWG